MSRKGRKIVCAMQKCQRARGKVLMIRLTKHIISSVMSGWQGKLSSVCAMRSVMGKWRLFHAEKQRCLWGGMG